MSKNLRKTNPRFINLINDLRTVSRVNGVMVWRDIARRLERPTRNYSEVNLSRINRYTSADDTVLIPGKVLGAGSIEHKLTVAALSFSDSAVEKILEKGGSCLTIEELVKSNPNGSGIKIMQ